MLLTCLEPTIEEKLEIAWNGDFLALLVISDERLKMGLGTMRRKKESMQSIRSLRSTSSAKIFLRAIRPITVNNRSWTSGYITVPGHKSPRNPKFTSKPVMFADA